MSVKKTPLEKLRAKIEVSQQEALTILSTMEKRAIEECHCDRPLGIIAIPSSSIENVMYRYCITCGGIVYG